MLEKDEGLKELYKPNGTLLVEGDLLKRENLADTLELIATEGADAFYNVGACGLFHRKAVDHKNLN